MKSLVWPLQTVWNYHKENTPFDKQVSEALGGLGAIQGIIDEYKGDVFFPDHLA